MPSSEILSLLSMYPIVNAHTHIGDAFISLKRQYGIQELVGPGGLKHKCLQRAVPSTIIGGMKKALQVMKDAHTTHFCDFREGGLGGIHLLKEAVDETVSPIILSRPADFTYNKKEVDMLLAHSAGIGVSSLSDWEYPEITKLAKHAERKKKVFALHASERVQEPIDMILDLHPTFLVHMTQASPQDFEVVADHEIPIIVCPRSNAYFGHLPNISVMKQAGVPLMLGTDNVMITPPNILEEARFVLHHFDISPEEVHEMLSINPRKYLNVIQGYPPPRRSK